MAVRLYLSSFRMGDHPEHLLALIGAGSRRAVVIANAMDDAPPDVRRAGGGALSRTGPPAAIRCRARAKICRQFTSVLPVILATSG